MEKFRLLNADEIECKVSRINEYGANILLYKTARTDMDLLDETVGPENWTDDYKEIKGNLYCGIGIQTEKNGMVWKWDCGIESRQDGDGNEKKGEASDAFKRAGFRWGIGRELYTSPEIFVPADKLNMKQNERTGKWATYDKLIVSSIFYDDARHIKGLTLKNAKTGRVVFSTDEKVPRSPAPVTSPAAPAIKCENCGAELAPIRKRDGEMWMPQEQMVYSMKRFKRCLCGACMKAAEKAEKQE